MIIQPETRPETKRIAVKSVVGGESSELHVYVVHVRGKLEDGTRHVVGAPVAKLTASDVAQPVYSASEWGWRFRCLREE